ncbi:putative family 31 glucosidase [Armadillidium vulgare]|nr:putative family 31 glucosidase [Armadillidium vulgare]
MPDNDGDGRADQMCFSSRYELPFVAQDANSSLNLTYYMCFDEDVRKIEIDDRWETCYGDARFDPSRFPDPKKMSMGYRVTVWVTPFINNDCESFAIADEAKYLVKDENGTTQLTSWWNGNETGIVDFTNPDAVNWWTGRLNRLIEENGIDRVAQWLTTAYINTVSSFGNISEIRTGVGNQHNPVFVRMLDKSSVWSEENGLRSLIPSLFHSGFLGYPFEINATEITRNVAKLHADFIDTFLDLARRAVQGEGPMMRPTWWLCPKEEECLLANQQFLLGDDILVTPVVYEGATTLDVIFPPGRWIQSDTGEVYEGFSKETISNITIESNIYFRRA